MALLLTYSQQQGIKKISPNNQIKYDQFAAEVEEKELRSMLGVALLQDLQNNPASVNNVKLLDGTDYVNCINQTIHFKGIRYILAYLNYAKYIGESFVNDTFTGFVAKNRPESELISEGTIRRLVNENREIALTEWEIGREYLTLNSEDYPLWLYSKVKKPFTPRLWGVHKTRDENEEPFHFPVPRT
jgi:hypothetical protein